MKSWNSDLECIICRLLFPTWIITVMSQVLLILLFHCSNILLLILEKHVFILPFCTTPNSVYCKQWHKSCRSKLHEHGSSVLNWTTFKCIYCNYTMLCLYMYANQSTCVCVMLFFTLPNNCPMNYYCLLHGVHRYKISQKFRLQLKKL